MYNILISCASAILLFVLLKFAFGLHWFISVLVAMLAFAAAFYFLSRFIMKKVTDIMDSAAKDLQAQRVEKAIRELKDAFRYAKWQIWLDGQINAQIGTIYYMRRDFSNAFPFLEKAFFKNWVAMGMLAITFMKRNKNDRMRATFEKATQASPKEPLLWSLYAYCLCEIGDNAGAKETLEKGLKKLPGNEAMKGNLGLLEEGKKMKMRQFGDMWFQFHLESVGALQKHQMAAMGGQKRRVIRK
jgi:tetratricopeptide (TPR) repeat protein